MNQEKYIGMDVHAATISAAVMNAQGKVLTKCVMGRHPPFWSSFKPSVELWR